MDAFCSTGCMKKPPASARIRPSRFASTSGSRSKANECRWSSSHRRRAVAPPAPSCSSSTTLRISCSICHRRCWDHHSRCIGWGLERELGPLLGAGQPVHRQNRSP
eukprot:scaffold285919_cov39-Tisochrysis_lutea.AAC.1